MDVGLEKLKNRVDDLISNTASKQSKDLTIMLIRQIPSVILQLPEYQQKFLRENFDF